MSVKRNLTKADLEDIQSRIELGILKAHEKNQVDCEKYFDLKYAHNGIHHPTEDGTMLDGSGLADDSGIPNNSPVSIPKRIVTTRDTYYILFIIAQLLFCVLQHQGVIP